MTEKSENATISGRYGHFRFVFEENSGAGKSHDYREAIVVEKLRF